jgi:hypothetical protein
LYNVENLYDTIDDPLTADEEFLPTSVKKWDETKYHKKLKDLARVITDINHGELLALVGLAEVKNRQVLVDLKETGKLKGTYTLIHEESSEPFNVSLNKTLVRRAPGSGAALVNLMIPESEDRKGSYFYRGHWNMLDNFVVSESVFQSKDFTVEGQRGKIFSKDRMIYINKEGIKTPNRSYVGNKYVGGVSDHFPVYFRLIVK